jgi:hypothetical protein
MKRIGSLLAAVSVLLPGEDIRPPQGISPQNVYEGLDSRYNFLAKPPGVGSRNQLALGGASPFGSALTTGTMFPMIRGISSISGISGLAGIGSSGGIAGAELAAPASFRNGTFSAGQQTIAIQQLDLNLAADPGSISIQMNSTEFADIILDDVFDVLSTAFGIRNLAGLARQYSSNVVVEFDTAIERKIRDLALIQEIINGALQTAPSDTYSLERLSFGTDSTTIPMAKAQSRQPFVIERRANHSFSENRYFSGAPMKTENHFQTLEQIAALIEE